MSGKLQANIAAIGLTHGSPSQLEKPICLRLFEYVYLKDERKNIPTNVPAIAGGAAHDAIQGILCDGLAPAIARNATDDVGNLHACGR